jgi:hypothetical protein
MSGNSAGDETEPFPLLESTAAVDLPAPSSSVSPPVDVRRQRRRSSTISGPNPAEIPLTESDHRLAEQIRRINLQNAFAARSQPRRQFPPSLPFRSAYPGTYGEANSDAPRTPTQEIFPTSQDPIPSISVPEIFSPRPSRNRNNLSLDLARRLSPIPDTSEEKTPTGLSLSGKSPNLTVPRSRSGSGNRTPTQAGSSSRSPTESSNNRD